MTYPEDWSPSQADPPCEANPDLQEGQFDAEDHGYVDPETSDPIAEGIQPLDGSIPASAENEELPDYEPEDWADDDIDPVSAIIY